MIPPYDIKGDAQPEVGVPSKPEKPSRSTTILAAFLRNFLISLTVRLYIYFYRSEKTVKTVADIAMPDQAPAAPAPLRFPVRWRARIQVLHYAIRTGQAYRDWIKRYIRYFGYFDKRHPRELSAAHVERFLGHPAPAWNLAAATQNQAKSALVPLFNEVPQVE